MVWTTPVLYTDVRAEYPLMTSTLRANAFVTIDIGVAENEIEALLRDKYALTDPGADAVVWRACLVRALTKGLNAVYGSEGWQDRMGTAVGMYYDEWVRFADDIRYNRIKLSLPVSATVQTPSVSNLDLGESDYSQFDLNSKSDFSLPLPNEE
jgi:hypothetical protein